MKTLGRTVAAVAAMAALVVGADIALGWTGLTDHRHCGIHMGVEHC
jgi:hypothetical protein